MKQIRNMITAFALCAAGVGASAQKVTVADVEAMPGETVAFTLNLTGGKADTYTAMQFDAHFPTTGFATTGKYTISELWENVMAIIGDIDAEGVATIPVASSETIGAADVEGLLSVYFSVGSDVPAGEYSVTLTDLWFGYGTSSKDYLDDVTFKVNVVDRHNIVLDENSTTMPVAVGEASDVLLKRSIKADSWSTIVLPFEATGEQVKAAFGDDVELAEFTGWNSEEDDEGAIVAINATFERVDAEDGIAANTPLLIRVSNDVTSVTFNDVLLEPEEAPEVRVGKTAKTRAFFYGTYVSTFVPEENVFLNGNKFWYSTGATPIKGYRGYFEFRDVLDSYYNVSEIKVNLSIDGLETSVEDIANCHTRNGQWYDLSGRKVSKPCKHGVYLVNGKKAMIK